MQIVIKSLKMPLFANNLGRLHCILFGYFIVLPLHFFNHIINLQKACRIKTFCGEDLIEVYSFHTVTRSAPSALPLILPHALQFFKIINKKAQKLHSLFPITVLHNSDFILTLNLFSSKIRCSCIYIHVYSLKYVFFVL